jgi:hypothetical protein
MTHTPLYHGVTVRDAVLMIAAEGGTVTPAAIRKWVQRGHIQRTQDGQIDPLTLLEWWTYHRDHTKGKRQVA